MSGYRLKRVLRLN